jgi:hypothetical protein
MRRYIIILIILVHMKSYGQADNLTIEQKRLAFIQGAWTIDGSETTYIEICDWIQGNHLQCISTSKEDKADNSISYLSYSALEKIYIYYGLYGSGNSRTLRGQWVDDKFIFEASDKRPISLRSGA